jgi:thiamine biosynthesis lipoprotein
MGTTYTVKVVAGTLSEQEQAELADAVNGALERVNGLMSTYLASSELSRFNQSRSGEPFALSPETSEVFALSRRIGALSGGAFDITVGPLVNAWGFGPPGKPARPPSDEELARLDKLVGWDKIELDEQASTVRKRVPEVYCDLSAVAKGYAVDQVSEALTSLGHGEHMVEVGGEVRTHGRNAEGQPWRIGVESPAAGGRGVERVLPIEDLAVATSGDYRNFYEDGGRRISHTIDPRTSRPIAHRLASVTVVADRCAEADAWATALMVLGEEEGARLASERDLAALLLVHDGSGFSSKPSPRFERMFAGVAASTAVH